MADFTIRVFKAFRSRAIERAWSNSYEIVTGESGPADLTDIAGSIVTAERAIHLTDVEFLQYTISTWAPDSHPYNPASFLTVGLSVTGNRGNVPPPNTNALDYNVCFVVKRNAATGRTGRLFYRGCLLETDVEMGGDGRFTMSTGSGLLQGGAQFTPYLAALSSYLGVTGAGPGLALIGVSGATTHRRFIGSLSSGGVTVNKKNHRYFDRAP